MDCDHCKRKFTTKSSLTNHQKTAKYCLKIQGKENQKAEFICKNCGVEFIIRKTLRRHLETCKAKENNFLNLQNKIIELKHSYQNKILESESNFQKEKEILENKVKFLEEDRKNLQKRYDKLAKILATKSTTTNNKNTNNIVNLSIFSKTSEDIDRVVDEKYTKDYLRDGQTGVAQFTKRHLINTDPEAPLEYIVTDRSRFHGKFVGENNESIPDTNMQGLTEKIHPSIDKKACKIMRGENDVFSDQELINGFSDVRRMVHDNSQFCKVFTKLHDVKNLPDGKKSQILEFIIEDSSDEN